MTMTPERLAELDAAYEKQAGTPFGENWIHLNTAAKHHIFAAYPDLRAHIDAQAATIARLREAAKRIADHPNFYITACECGEPECATTQFIAAIAEAEGAQ